MNKIERKEYNRQYYIANKKKIDKISNEYRMTHKEIIKKYQKKYYKKYWKLRIKHDMNFKMVRNLRTRIWHALRGENKSQSTMKLLGCSIEYLKVYLEKQFKKGMSWLNNNKTGWHIDHIKPCASFDLSKKSEQRKCFHYTNLQPLWAKENKRKGARLS